MANLRPRQMLGKYKLEKKIADGGFSTVFKAMDTIEGIHVALKVPHSHHINDDFLDEILKEVRVTAKMDHPNILPIKNAGFIDDHFVIAYPLGDRTLSDRLARRMSVGLALDFTRQILSAVAHAHGHRVIHCDIKPDNLILFGKDTVRLTDFGISKLALRTRTVMGSGAGTVGYIAPEQALGKPSFRSDVFSLGLILYRMFAGTLPAWPFEWPPPGIERLRRNLHPDFIALIQRAINVDERKRFSDGQAMLSAFERVRPRALKSSRSILQKRTNAPTGAWRTVRLKEFQRRFGKALETRSKCDRCSGPMSQSMLHCPWCGKHHKTYKGTPTSFPSRCGRCERGMKHDWRFCAWCYGSGFDPTSTRKYSDVRYAAKCSNQRCKGQLMPFMRYCPWCRTKVRKKWKIEGSKDSCSSCGWGVLPEYWDYCPWCGKQDRSR